MALNNYQINGRIFNDVNSNCIQDNGELGLQSIDVQIGNQYAYTDVNGDYTITTPNKDNKVIFGTEFFERRSEIGVCSRTSLGNQLIAVVVLPRDRVVGRVDHPHDERSH